MIQYYNNNSKRVRVVVASACQCRFTNWIFQVYFGKKKNCRFQISSTELRHVWNTAAEHK